MWDTKRESCAKTSLLTPNKNKNKKWKIKRDRKFSREKRRESLKDVIYRERAWALKVKALAWVLLSLNGLSLSPLLSSSSSSSLWILRTHSHAHWNEEREERKRRNGNEVAEKRVCFSFLSLENNILVPNFVIFIHKDPNNFNHFFVYFTRLQ